jgi:Fic family protein
MPIKFEPNYIISSKIMNCLIRIEAAKQKILHLPLTPTVLSSLRETARLYTTHYSTMIEGNRLDPDQVEEVLKHHGHFPGRERDEHEVKGYYAALTQVEKWAAQGVRITEKMIRILHGLVMANGKENAKPTEYRDGQNVIRDGRTITSRQIGELFGFKPRTSAALCANWVESGFLKMVDSSNKGRKYKLSAEYQKLIN